MPIKWSAVKVSQACDGVDTQLALAESFFAEAKRLAEEAQKLPNLPQYIDQKLSSLASDLGYRIESLKNRVDSIRKNIPDGAIEAEQAQARYGSQQSLV